MAPSSMNGSTIILTIMESKVGYIINFLNLKQRGWYLNFYSLFKKFNLWMEKDYNYKMKGILWKIKHRAVNFLVAQIYKMNFWGVF